MSKGNMLLGHARGKVGSLVFSRSNGKQITRTRAEVIKNPRTYKQFIQRVLLNTCSQAYSFAKPIADHSFQGKQEGQANMSEFMKKNLEYLRNRVAEIVNAGMSLEDIYNFVPVGQSGLYPGAWILSDGKLPRVGCSIGDIEDDFKAKMIISATANTYGAIISDYGLKRGDQLTFITCEKSATFGDGTFNYVRVILDPREEDGTAASLDTPFITEGAITKPNSKNQGNFNFLTFSEGAIRLTITDGSVASAGVIVSREDNGIWERSKCQMVMSQDVAAEMNLMSLYEAIENSQGVSIDVVNALYLNNAGTGGGQSTNSGSSQPSTTTPTYNNNAEITANGSTITQNIAGGSTSVTGPLTKVKVSGSNLNNADLKAGSTNNAASAQAMTLTNNNTVGTWEGNIAAGSTLYVFKGSTLWFSVAATTAGGSNGDDNG